MHILDDGTGTPLARFVRDLDAHTAPALSVLTPDLDGASAEDIDAAQLGWASRIVDEYRSAVRFTSLLADLMAIDAPYPMLATVHRLIGDELRHAHLCARLAASFGPLDGLGVELDGLGWPRTRDDAAERALELVVRELVIGEGESLACMRAYRHATTDPACRALFDHLLEDEARHFTAGRHLEAMLRATYPRLVPFDDSLEDVLLEDVRAIRRQHRSDARGGPGRRYGVSIRLDEAPPEVE